MLKEFKEFALRGNVIDLAVGVIIGGAFGKIVSSFVADIVMPLISIFMPERGDWKLIEVGPGIKLGNFLGTVVDFLIVAVVIFLTVKAINAAKKKEIAEPSAPPADIILLTEIRDLLKNSKTPI